MTRSSFFGAVGKRKFVVWGGGKKCRTTIKWMEFHGIDIDHIVDSNANSLPNVLYDISVIDSFSFFNSYSDHIVIISTDDYYEEIARNLDTKGIKDYIAFSALDCIGNDNEYNRSKWIIDKLKQIDEGKRILDAGAGELKYKTYCNHLAYVSQDFCQYDGIGDVGFQMGKWDTSGIDIVSDIIDIPVSNESFDAILCSEVFEHIVSPHLAIKEFSRILKEGGKLILTAPFCSLTHFAPFHYSTGYNIFWYRKVLSEYGFEIIEEESNGDYFSYIAQELRRLEGVSMEYKGYEFDQSDKDLITMCLSFLDKINNISSKKNSSEVLCYGWQIVAIKNYHN